MKFNKYYIGAGVVLVIILIVVFTQRSDWDANRYILSADNEGNLEPKSEKYFDDKEKALLASVDAKIAAVNNRVTSVNNRVTSVDNKVNVQRRDFNNRAGHVDRHFTTKTEFKQLGDFIGPWADERYIKRGEHYKIFDAANQQLIRWGDNVKADGGDSRATHRIWRIV